MTMQALRQEPQWQYPLEVLKQQSPSLKDGISFDDELVRHSRGVRFLVDACEQLQLPLVTTFTAITFFHRFYLHFSHKSSHIFNTAGASVFLAAKIEETARRVKEVAAVCLKLGLKQPKMVVDPESKELQKWVEVIAHSEELLLEALYFDFEIKSLYTILKEQLHKAELTGFVDLQQRALQFMKEGCKTLIENVYTHEMIAASTILWATTTSSIEMPPSEIPWWQVLGMDRDKLVEVVNTTVAMLNITRKSDQPPLQEIS